METNNERGKEITTAVNIKNVYASTPDMPNISKNG